nr:YgaB family protein [uncultured Bacillus sp.]
MNEFNRLVTEQLKIMDRLLFLQSELERCQEIEMQLQRGSQLESVQLKMVNMKKELKEIQQVFEKQTEEVIRSYQEAVNVSI